MGSSVDIFCAFCLWNTFCEKSERTNHILRKLWISWGFFRFIPGFLRRFLHCELPQVVLVKVKAGYQAQLQNHALYPSPAQSLIALVPLDSTKGTLCLYASVHLWKPSISGRKQSISEAYAYTP